VVSRVQKAREKLILDVPDYSKPITEPEEVEIARKGTRFRVVLERKLGIDWEHAPADHSELVSNDESLQTNEMQDGYNEVCTPSNSTSFLRKESCDYGDIR
jgi:hypothetical protein